ncbi:hypothetical protein M8998_03830 [Sphingobacterium sp. lm-10]|uniref:hypothetical protein n=1 Tax=Sphingobacterium sp. lm-10 TaxID=2944904 RepID=UPI00201FD78D|nr:hypothetical protein [Sphingobacterium sp. lm-10]MCL7987068.1 hypothetical protein [Sphingobacterium sp. lm-10]
MKYTALMSLMFGMIVSFSAFATEQAPDRLIVNGDTLLLHALPLQQWAKLNELERPLFPDSLSSFSTGCWRGYVAYWELIDNQLYLTGIYNGNHSAKVNLDTLFGNKVYDSRVPADWFTDKVTAYKGRLVYYQHAGFSSIHEDEFEYVFEKGILKTSAYFDNSLSTSTPRTMYQPVPIGTIDSLIHWATLPPIEENIYVSITLEVDQFGKVDSILGINGDFDVFNQEALRVVRLLTALPVTYKRGELLDQPLYLRFVFTRKKQQRFL